MLFSVRDSQFRVRGSGAYLLPKVAVDFLLTDSPYSINGQTGLLKENSERT